MKIILSYLKNYKKESILAPLFKMLEAIFELFIPLVIAGIIDNGIAKKDAGSIALSVGILAALAVIGLTCAATAQYFAAKAAIAAASKMRSDLFSHFTKLSYHQVDMLSTDTMITRLTSDINQVQNGINMVLRLFLRSPFIVFGAMIMAFTIDAGQAFVFLLTIILLTAVVYGIMFITMPLYKKVQTMLDGLLRRTRENLTGVRVIRAFSGEKAQAEIFDEENLAMNSLQLKVGSLSALTNPLTFIIVNAATMILLYTGALKVFEGVLTKGQVVALINYMSQILVELVKLANLIITITKALACAKRVEDVFAMKPDMKDGTIEILDSAECGDSESKKDNEKCVFSSVEFEKVSFSYIEGKECLSNISFKASRGQVIGIIGGTGSGKSSLVNLIPRFYDAAAGCVKIDGVDVKSIKSGLLAENIAVVPQKAVLMSGTILDNLRYRKENADENEAIEALKDAQAWEFVSDLPEGLFAEVAQGGRNFSGGQRQRLTIARALVGQPAILILDDSSSALDYATDERLRKALYAKKQDRITFIVSQRTRAISQADNILVLDDGRLVMQGTHEKLLEECSLYREIHESQFKNTGVEF